MNAEKRLNWAHSELLKAMQEGLRGNVTFQFDNGVMVSAQKTAHCKPDVDDSPRNQ